MKEKTHDTLLNRNRSFEVLCILCIHMIRVFRQKPRKLRNFSKEMGAFFLDFYKFKQISLKTKLFYHEFYSQKTEHEMGFRCMSASMTPLNCCFVLYFCVYYIHIRTATAMFYAFFPLRFSFNDLRK